MKENKVKLGFNTFLFTPRFTDDSYGLFKQFREFGAGGAEIALENKGDIDYPRTLEAIRENGLVCSSICGAFGEGRDLRGTPKEQETSTQYIRDCVDAAVALKTDVVVGPLYSRVGRAGAESSEDKQAQWKVVVRHLKELGKYAADKGVCLGIEPLNRFESDFINVVEDALRLCDDVGCENVMLHIDLFHSFIEERNVPLAIAAAGKRLLHVHAADNYRGAPGTGSMDWQGIRDALNLIDFERYVVLETFTPEVEVLAKAAAIWREYEESNLVLARKGMNYLKALFA